MQESEVAISAENIKRFWRQIIIQVLIAKISGKSLIHIYSSKK